MLRPCYEPATSVFVFPLLSLSLAQRRVWLGEATKSGAAMAAPAAPAPTALTNVMSLWDSKWGGSLLEIVKRCGRSDVVKMMEEAIRCK